MGGFSGFPTSSRRVLAVTACAAACLASATARADPAAPARPAAPAVALRPSADAYVSKALPHHTFGTKRRLRADHEPVQRAYLRFSVPSVVGTATSAELRLYAADHAPTGGSVYAVPDDSWRERSLTWSNKPRLGRRLGTLGPVSPGLWVSVDVSSLVDGPGTYSVAVTSESDDGVVYVSREGAVERRPRLQLDRETDPIIAAAGDIACAPNDRYFNDGKGTKGHCRQKATSDLVIDGHFDAVLTLGDNQYEEGTLAAFRRSYDLSWGRFRSITHPAVGDHEYETPNAQGYFDYFGAAAGDPDLGYYSFDVGSWHIVALNSNCTEIGGCWWGSDQEKWLRADLKSNAAACTLAYWHNPRWSSNGGTSSVDGLWEATVDLGADVVLNGNFHHYERFAPQDSAGRRDDAHGVREFVVGTGGEELYDFQSTAPNSEVRHKGFGILELSLHSSSYEWRFIGIGGKVIDSGQDACH